MLKGITPAEALQIVLDHTPRLGAETTAVADARGRVLVEGIRSTRQLPPLGQFRDGRLRGPQRGPGLGVR